MDDEVVGLSGCGARRSLSPRRSRGGSSKWDAEEGFERVFVEELGAVVGEQGLEFVAVGAEVAAVTASWLGATGAGAIC